MKSKFLPLTLLSIIASYSGIGDDDNAPQPDATTLMGMRL